MLFRSLLDMGNQKEMLHTICLVMVIIRYILENFLSGIHLSGA